MTLAAGDAGVNAVDPGSTRLTDGGSCVTYRADEKEPDAHRIPILLAAAGDYTA